MRREGDDEKVEMVKGLEDEVGIEKCAVRCAHKRVVMAYQECQLWLYEQRLTNKCISGKIAYVCKCH